MKDNEHWNPSVYMGASEEFQRARIRECCILLGRSLHRENIFYLPPKELLPYVPAIAQTINTVLTFRGVSSGAYAFILKDSVISSELGWKESAAMFLGVADRLLDYYFDIFRHWGSETFVQSLFASFSNLSKGVLHNEDRKESIAFIGWLAHFMAIGGLTQVPGVPNAREVFGKAIGPFVNTWYSLFWDGRIMKLVKEHRDKQEKVIISYASVCSRSEELLYRIWNYLENNSLHGPVDHSSIATPHLGDFGSSKIYRDKIKAITGEIVVPLYAAHFEYDPSAMGIKRGKFSVGDLDPRSISDIFFVASEGKEETRVFGVDVTKHLFLFEFLVPFAARQELLKWLPGMGGNWKTHKHIEDIKEENKMAKKEIRTFIVHGHAEKLKWELKNYLWSTLGLPEPIILHEQPNLGRTIMEKFETYAGKVSLVFVLLTPDDVGSSADSPNELKHRARQNVIFEMGYFLGMLKRLNGKVIFLHQGPLELPSDLSGIIYIDISEGIKAAGEDIRRELKGILEENVGSV